jgi:uncharacterized membrane protein YoaK (UPF0700 family)
VISKLPRWILAGGWGLAFMAGFANVIGLLGFDHQAVTHLTGTTSMVAAAVADLDFARASHLLTTLASFVAGCVVSGFLVRDNALTLGPRYGVALGLEALLFAGSVAFLNRGNQAGMYFAASACGLQNGMISVYSGMVIRTTHISGMFTDLGIFLGHRLRGLQVDARRLRLCLNIISAFFTGGVAGALAFRRFAYNSLLIPASLAAAAALFYTIHQLRERGKNAHS